MPSTLIQPPCLTRTSRNHKYIHVYHGCTLINTPCTRVATRKRWAQAEKNSRFSLLVFFHPCNSVLIRGKMVLRFSCHFEKNLTRKRLRVGRDSARQTWPLRGRNNNAESKAPLAKTQR